MVVSCSDVIVIVIVIVSECITSAVTVTLTWTGICLTVYLSVCLYCARTW